MKYTFADWIGRKTRLPYTTWGDFLRVCQQSSELASIHAYNDLLQLVAKYRFDNGVSDARRAWKEYGSWARSKELAHPSARP